MFVIDFLYIK